MQPLQLMSGCLWAKKGGNRGNGERRAMVTVRTGGLVAFEAIFYFFFSFFVSGLLRRGGGRLCAWLAALARGLVGEGESRG